MIKLVKVGDSYVNGMHKEYVIDSSSDIDNLPGIDECAAGSIAKSMDGITYIMSPSGDWGVYNSVSGSSGVVVTQTITSGAEIGSVNGTKLYAPQQSSSDGTNANDGLDSVIVTAIPVGLFNPDSLYPNNIIIVVSNFDSNEYSYYFRTKAELTDSVIYNGQLPGSGWSRLPSSNTEITPMDDERILEVAKIDKEYSRCIGYGVMYFR